ncbi:hypothetical protein [Anderseniella sp. Alg231-50]
MTVRQRNRIAASEPSFVGFKPTSRKSGFKDFPDVPQHPLDGPIPTD